MNKMNAGLLGMLLLALAGCGRSAAPAGADEHGHAGESAEAAKGPHGGRLLRHDDFSLELAIFESGVPPEYRAWARFKDAALPPEQVQLRVELTRLGSEKNLIRFAPAADFLRGDAEVSEPHSFEVTVVATHQGREHRWQYESFEGRVTIGADSARSAGIVAEAAGPALIRDTLPLYGRIVATADGQRSVTARFPGQIRSVAKALGDTVRAGDMLARIESNDSLQVYAVTSPIAGVVAERRANPGEQAGTEPLFTISNLDQVWAELSVFPRDLPRLKPGQTVRVKSLDEPEGAEGRLVSLSPAAGRADQALSARVLLDNSGRRWTPGLYVSAEALIGGAQVPLAVKTAALQQFRDSTVVFEQVGDSYEVRMLELGRSDGEFSEVLGGLKPGARYVSGNSYLVKADIEKSGASHDH